MRSRVVSLNSKEKVFHNENCRYVKGIPKKRKVVLDYQEAIDKGYRPCKCCHKMGFLVEKEKSILKGLIENNSMRVKVMHNRLYVKTTMGLWMIKFSVSKQRFYLMHGNSKYEEFDINNAYKAFFHEQRDNYCALSIASLFDYIIKHDRYRKQVMLVGGDERKVKVNKKFAKRRSNKAKRAAIHRINALFSILDEAKASNSVDRRALTSGVLVV